MEVTSVCVTPDGKTAVSGDDEGTLRVWDLKTFTELAVLKGHSNKITRMSTTPDGRRAVSGSKDKTIHVWDLESFKELAVLEGHSETVTSVFVTLDGKRAVSTSEDGTVRVWDLGMMACVGVWYAGAYNAPSAIDVHGRLPLGKENRALFPGLVPALIGQPLVTPRRLWLYSTDGAHSRWDGQLTAVCPWCGQQIQLDRQIVECIQGLRNQWISFPGQSSSSIPPEAWDDPALVDECSSCGNPLRFNPFVADNSDLYALQDEATALEQQAGGLRRRGDYEAAAQLYRQILDLWLAYQGPQGTGVFPAMSGLALSLQLAGCADEARVLEHDLKAVCDKLMQGITPSPDFAGLSGKQLDVEQRREIYWRCRTTLDIDRRVYGKHPKAAKSMHNLAKVAIECFNDRDEALALCLRAMEILLHRFGPGHPDSQASLEKVGSLLASIRLDGLKTASDDPAFWRRVITYTELTGNFDGLEARIAQKKIVNRREELEDWEGAETERIILLAMEERALGPDSPEAWGSLVGIAKVREAKSDYDGAEKEWREPLARRERSLGSDHEETSLTVYYLGLCLENQSNYDEAAACFRRRLATLTAPDDTQKAASVQIRLQTVLHLAGKPVDLEKLAEATRLLEDAGDKWETVAKEGRALMTELGQET